MADIIHEFTVKAQPERVFQAFATASGQEKWWTVTPHFVVADLLKISRHPFSQISMLLSIC